MIVPYLGILDNRQEVACGNMVKTRPHKGQIALQREAGTSVLSA